MKNVKEKMDKINELAIGSESMDDKLCVIASEGPIEAGTMYDIASDYCSANEEVKNLINTMFYKFTGRYFDAVFCEWADEDIAASVNADSTEE